MKWKRQLFSVFLQSYSYSGVSPVLVLVLRRFAGTRSQRLPDVVEYEYEYHFVEYEYHFVEYEYHFVEYEYSWGETRSRHRVVPLVSYQADSMWRS